MKRYLIISVLAIAAVSCSRSPQKSAQYMASGKALIQKGEYTSALLQFKNAARLLPRNAEPLYYMGLISITQDNAKNAIQYLSRATQVDPKYTPAQIKLAELMVLSRRQDLLQEAERRARLVLQQHPRDPDALAILASIRSQSGDLNSAEKELRQVLEEQPGQLQSSAGLASLEISRGNWDAAEAILKQAIAAAPGSPDPLVALGEIYSLRHRQADAAAEFHRALQFNPDNAPALLHLAQLAISQGRAQDAENIYRHLAGRRPGQFRELLASYLSESGKLDAAVSEYRAILKADPENRRARNGLVNALIKAGRNGEATSILQSALDKNPNDVDALQEKAKLLFDSGHYEASRPVLMQLLQYEPNSAEAHYMLAGVYKLQRQFARQYQELNEALRLNPQLLSARIELARALLRDNKASDALHLLDRAPAEQQQSPLLIAQRNWTFLALHDLHRFASGIPNGAAGNTPEFLLQRGLLKLANKDFAGAETTFESILAQSPREVRALDGLAETCVRERRPDLALAKVRFYSAKQRESAEVQLYAGNWFLRYGHPEEARTAFQAALATDPGNTGAVLALALLDENAGNAAEAEQRLQKLLARDDHDAAAQLMLAELEQSAGKNQAAILHYRKAVEISPNDPTVLNNFAWALLNSPGQTEQALVYAQKAKELAPDDPAIDDTLGWILCRKGMYHPALECVKAAAAKAHNAIAEYHLAILYFRLGNVALGKQALDAAKRMDPSLAEARLAEQALAEAMKKSGTRS